MKRKPRLRMHGGRASTSLATRWDHDILPKVADGISAQAHPTRAYCGSRPRSEIFYGPAIGEHGRAYAKASTGFLPVGPRTSATEPALRPTRLSTARSTIASDASCADGTRCKDAALTDSRGRKCS